MPPVVNRRQLLQTAAALAAPTVLPAWAAICAMPRPMAPVPTMPIEVKTVCMAAII